jgi:hypothetical protein
MRIALAALAYGAVMALAAIIATVVTWSGRGDEIVPAAVLAASAVLLVGALAWLIVRAGLGLLKARSRQAYASAGALANGVPVLLVSLLEAYGPTPPLTMALALVLGLGGGLAAWRVERGGAR